MNMQYSGMRKNATNLSVTDLAQVYFPKVLCYG